MATKYALTDTQVRHLAIICYREQGSNDAGVRACASHMCNYYEKWQKRNFPSVYECTFGSGWYWGEAKNRAYVTANPTVPDSVVKAVREVIVEGKRTLPEYVDEYDCLTDVRRATNNGLWFPPEDRSQYIPNVTKIENVYNSTYTFYCFPDGVNGYCDAFGYISKGNGSKSDSGASESVSGVSQSDGTTYANQRIIEYGSSGQHVLLLQKLLMQKGYRGANGKPLTLDGVCGDNTYYAICKFQKDHGLIVDGICGKKTWMELLKA